ncbi:hypothetical protein D9757_008263 [Collybiopsis confluens]|uniref:Phosphatidic acid phosphatase type 2/haloperoxidase domain-containing protein n=1 Tax=Collybiopsis confluens TaxID=2823264 RepID=A0A8H5H4F4_9AGAR|nr:hypothetical protein D9757_008263 [Collybiopsis confluens]
MANRYINSPFHLAVWLRLHGVDLITMALMGALGLGIYEAPPAPSRSFPVYFQNGEVVYPQFAYPLRKEIVPIWAAALIAFFVPFFFFSLFQVRRRSLNDWMTTTMGLLKSLITAAVFQVFLKWLIGGLRPHFLSVCQPNIQANATNTGLGTVVARQAPTHRSPSIRNAGKCLSLNPVSTVRYFIFASLMYDRTVCTGNKDDINDSLESFPSGHSTAGWAGLFYLALYFNAQLKVLSAHNPAYWKMILMLAPLLGATLISGALTIDEFHNWYDVLAGAIIGISTALIAFRQTFASIFDFRFNHILLPRTTSLFHQRPLLSNGVHYPFYTYRIATEELPFTREGGWAQGQEALNGAPGDATFLLRGGNGGALVINGPTEV